MVGRLAKSKDHPRSLLEVRAPLDARVMEPLIPLNGASLVGLGAIHRTPGTQPMAFSFLGSRNGLQGPGLIAPSEQ